MHDMLFTILLFTLAGCCHSLGNSTLEGLTVCGPYALGFRELTTSSPFYNETIHEYVWYPSGARSTFNSDHAVVYPLPSYYTSQISQSGDVAPIPSKTFPIIFVTAGAFNNPGNLVRLCENLSTWGFIVVSFGLGLEDALAAESELANFGSIAKFYDDFHPRLFQVSWEITRWTEQDNFLSASIMPDKIGVTGYSAGGGVALLTGYGHEASGYERDERVKAIAPIDMACVVCFIEEEKLFNPAVQIDPANLPQLRTPTNTSIQFIVSGVGFDDGDPTTLDLFAIMRLQSEIVYPLIDTSGVKMWVKVEGASHMHFIDACELIDYMVSLGIAEKDWGTIVGDDYVTYFKQLYKQVCGPDASLSALNTQEISSLYLVGFFKSTLTTDNDGSCWAGYLSPQYSDGCAVRTQVKEEGLVLPEKIPACLESAIGSDLPGFEPSEQCSYSSGAGVLGLCLSSSVMVVGVLVALAM